MLAGSVTAPLQLAGGDLGAAGEDCAADDFDAFLSGLNPDDLAKLMAEQRTSSQELSSATT